MLPLDSPIRDLWGTYVPPPVPDDKVEDKSSDSDDDAPVAHPQASHYDAHINTIMAEGIRLRTSEEAIASGKRALACTTKKAKKMEPFTGVSVYVGLFPACDDFANECIEEFPILTRSTSGPGHAIANCMTGLGDLVTGSNPMHFSKDRRQFEAGREPPRVYGKLPPWQASKPRLKAVASIMLRLKLPAGWPPIPPSLSDLSTMKLEQALAFAGHLGCYILELLDIDHVIHSHFQAYLRVLRDCQQKTPTIPLEDIKKRLDETAAALEVVLPAFWTSSTKHNAIHLDLFQEYWGCFWASNELIHERIMAKLKLLSKYGNRDRMFTLASNWDIFQTANDWLLNAELKLHYKVACNPLTMSMLPTDPISAIE